MSLVVASPSCGLACSVAALAEHQHKNGDSAIISSSTAPAYYMVCSSCGSPGRMQSEVGNYPPERWIKALSNRKASPREYYEWRTDHEARGGRNYASSNLTIETQSVVDASHLLPDSFEVQMMLTMAISLAEFQAGARSSQGATWLQ